MVAKRDLIHWLREPVRVFANLAYPIISVLIFGLVFGSAMNVFGGGDYIEFLLPGMFGQTITFGVATTIMMAGMWLAEFPLDKTTAAGEPSMSTNPIVDYHVIYAIALIVAALTYAGNTWGLGRWWAAQPFVQRHPWAI